MGHEDLTGVRQQLPGLHVRPERVTVPGQNSPSKDRQQHAQNKILTTFLCSTYFFTGLIEYIYIRVCTHIHINIHIYSVTRLEPHESIKHVILKNVLKISCKCVKALKGLSSEN